MKTREIIEGVDVSEVSNRPTLIRITYPEGYCSCGCYCCDEPCSFCEEIAKNFKLLPERDGRGRWVCNYEEVYGFDPTVSPDRYWIKATEVEFLEWFQGYKENFQEIPVADQRWTEFIKNVVNSEAMDEARSKMNLWPVSLEAFLEHIKECEKSNVEKSGGNAEILDDLREKNAEDLGVNLNEYRRFLKRVDVIKVSVNTEELLLLFLPPVIPEGVKKAYEREKKLGAKKSIYFGLLTSEEDELPLDEQKEIKKNMEDLGIFRRGNRFPFDVKRGGKVVFTVAGYEFATANTSTLPSPKVVNGLDGLEEYKGKCIKAFHARYAPEPHGSWLYFFLDEEGWHMGEKLVTDNKTVQEIEVLYAFFCLH